jgi:hypothetical protein
MTTPCPNLTTFNLQCEQGATLRSQITLTLNGAPVDLTGATFEFTAKLDPNLPDSDPGTIKVDWTETATSTQGITWLTIPAATTFTMVIDDYDYQVRLVSATKIVTPLFHGILTIVQPVSPRGYTP